MRTFRLTEYLEKKSEFARKRLNSRRSVTRRDRIRRRQRSGTEERILMKLDRERWRRWLKDGKIEITGERHFRLHLDY